ncbi:restriction endonuclease subunit S [Metallibacterium sp.]
MSKSKQRAPAVPLEPLSPRERGRGEGTAEARHLTKPEPSSGPAGHLLPEGEGKGSQRAASSEPSSSSERSSSGWHTKRFDAFATLQRGFDLPVASRKVGTIPVLGSNGIVGWHDTVGIRGPGVVTGRSGSIGDSTFSDTDYWPLNTSLYVSNFHGNVPRFVHYFLQWFDLARFKGGVSVPTLNRNMVHGSEVTVPPKPEQQKIAAVLWKMQRTIATQNRLIAATRDLKQSAMQHLFTHGLHGEPLKDTAIGPMPESWDVVALGDFGRIGNGSTPRKTTPEYWRNPTTPWLTSAKVHDGIIRSADQFVSDVAVKECHLPIVPAGSLLVAITGQGKTLGNTALVEFETTISQHLAYVRFDRKDVVPSYVYQYMRSRYEQLQGIGRAGGSTKAALTCAFLRDYPLPLPSADEQHDIAAALATLDRKLAHHQRKRATLNDLFQTTLHQMMTAQIRVADLDIDISDVADPVRDAGKMIAGSGQNHFVDANEMIADQSRRPRR